MEQRNFSAPTKLRHVRSANTPANSHSPHPADEHVGRQLATIRFHSDITQAKLAKAVGISFQQLQKYENARNRISASMLYELATQLGVPVSRFFEGLPGNDRHWSTPAPLPIDERISFVASAEGRRMIEGLMRLHPRVRARVSSLIAAFGEEFRFENAEQ